MKWSFLYLSLMIYACASRPQLLDYISLPPPQEVSARLTAEGLVVSWELPPPYLLARIEQFNVYVSPKSLLYTPIEALPQPACVADRKQTRCLIKDVDVARDLFIHVRSQNSKGDLSLPSLPEIHLRPAQPSEK